MLILLLAYFHAPEMKGIPPDGLLGAIAIKILGKHAGLIVGLTVAIACLSTAIALIAAFANFMEKRGSERKNQLSSHLDCFFIDDFCSHHIEVSRDSSFFESNFRTLLPSTDFAYILQLTHALL